MTWPLIIGLIAGSICFAVFVACVVVAWVSKGRLDEIDPPEDM